MILGTKGLIHLQFLQMLRRHNQMAVSLAEPFGSNCLFCRLGQDFLTYAFCFFSASVDFYLFFNASRLTIHVRNERLQSHLWTKSLVQNKTAPSQAAYRSQTGNKGKHALHYGMQPLPFVFFHLRRENLKKSSKTV